MIRFLDNISEVKFPIATLHKTGDITDDASYIYYEGQALLKRPDLMQTFSINEAFLPRTYSYLYNPEALFADTSLLKGKLLIDSRLNIFIPAKRLELAFKSCTFMKKSGKLIKVTEYPFFIPEVYEKSAKYPKICIVENHPFLVGWTNTKVKPYETFI